MSHVPAQQKEKDSSVGKNVFVGPSGEEKGFTFKPFHSKAEQQKQQKEMRAKKRTSKDRKNSHFNN